MTAAAEKARYFLEQSLPEIRTLQTLNLLTPLESHSITQKRTDFEQRISATGPSPSDFLRYATFEQNLSSLLLTRSKRLRIKHKARVHYGPRRVFFIYDRAVRKFPGNLELWMAYLSYARQQKAGKVVEGVLGRCVKLHPGKWEVWVLGAGWKMEEGDVEEARVWLQRGLRFCKKSRGLWVEYAKLELAFIGKVTARRELLGIDEKPATEKEDGDVDMAEDDDLNADTVVLPSITHAELDPEAAAAKEKKLGGDVEALALENIDTNPALNGAVPMIVFDQAMREIPDSPEFALDFLRLFADYPALRCSAKLVQHVVKHLLETAGVKTDIRFWVAWVLLQRLEVVDPAYPGKLGEVLKALKEVDSKKVEERTRRKIYGEFVAHMVEKLRDDGERMDEGLKKVIEGAVKRTCKRSEEEKAISPEIYGCWYNYLTWRGKDAEAEKILLKGRQKFPDSAALEAVGVIGKQIVKN